MPIVLDAGRLEAVSAVARPRMAGQLMLGGLMTAALAALVVARAPLDGPQVPPAASPLVGAAVGASPVPLRTLPLTGPGAPGGSVAPTPQPSAAPSPPPPSTPPPATPAPTVAPSLVATRTYTVRSGDTLYGIAIEFETTVRAIKRLNGLTSNDLRAGQVLNIP